jgi:hypothetical protein
MLDVAFEFYTTTTSRKATMHSITDRLPHAKSGESRGINQLRRFARRVRKNLLWAFRREGILHAHQLGWVSSWCKNFYLNTLRVDTKALTPQQRYWRQRINWDILRKLDGLGLTPSRKAVKSGKAVRHG